MIDGHKELPRDLAATEPPAAPLWRAALVGLASLAFVGGLTAGTDFSATRASLKAGETQSDTAAQAPSD